MKKKLLFCLLISSCISIGIVSCSEVEYDTFGTISGTVYDYSDESRHPLSTANVTLNPSGKNVFTQADGHFAFANLEPDIYIVQVQKDGYKTNRKNVTVEPGKTTSIDLVMEKE